jgi:hypothetical protein
MRSHLIVTHEATNSASDRAQRANVAKQAKAVLKTETLEAVADRGFFSSSLELLACHEAGITVTLPKPQTSGAKSDGRFGKQDFVYLPEEDAYRCPAGEQLPDRFKQRERNHFRLLRRVACTILTSRESQTNAGDVNGTGQKRQAQDDV